MDRQRTERTLCKSFICVSVDNIISKCPKPPKDLKKRQKTVCSSERRNRTFQKGSENGDNDNNRKIYASMAQMSGND